MATQIFFYFHPEIWGNDPNWLIFFRWVETIVKDFRGIKSTSCPLFDVPCLETYKTMTYEQVVRRWWVQCITEESWVVNVSKPCTHTRPSSLSFFEDGYETTEALYSYISRGNAYCTSNFQYIRKHKCATHFMTFILLHFHIWWSFLPYKKTQHTWNRGPERSGPRWKGPFLRGDDKLLGFMAKLRWSCWANNSVVWRRLWRLFPGGP